jgi:hypothetical protein
MIVVGGGHNMAARGNMNPNEILGRVEDSVGTLSPRLQSWARAHLIVPHRIELSNDVDGKDKSIYWLVTDHTGNQDSSCRVAYDEEFGQFGLECTLQDGTHWFMGIYGTFAEAIESM